jgi:hypothetical protein
MELLPVLQQYPWYAQAVVAVIVLNIVLSAVSQALDVLKLQEKAPWLAKVAVVVKKLVDVVSANVAHKQ